jgi:hypothetical protein
VEKHLMAVVVLPEEAVQKVVVKDQLQAAGKFWSYLYYI